MQKTIGQKLNELRKELGITIEELGNRSGISRQQINYYELERGLPTIPTLQKLAKGLECSVFDIIDEPLGREDGMCIHFRKCMFYNKNKE